jgi:geranylgeranyl diphosphate synthase type II
MNVKEFLEEKGSQVDAALEKHLASWCDAPESLIAAMRYSLFAGGKRLRPALVLGAAEVASGYSEIAMPAACAVEMIHTYSLIHDDLPAMDNDALRRGQPTAHIKFGEAGAILAGDALLTMAFEVAAQSGNFQVLREIARAAGVGGMVGGQQLDLEAEGKSLPLNELQHIHAFKTGAMIRVSVRAGAILAGGDPQKVEALTRYGECIGLAFQITDDILDVVGTEAVLGKPIGSDATQNKSTYPALVGLDQARVLADEAVASALLALECFDARADIFRELARFIVERES